MELSPILAKLKDRRQKFEYLRKKCKENRQEVDDWARRVFVFFHRDKIDPLIVRPIIEDLIEQVVIFGHGRDQVSFRDVTTPNVTLPNNYGQHRF